MTKKSETGPVHTGDKGLSRREFFKQGAAAGVGAMALGAGAPLAEPPPTDDSVEWN